MERCSTHTAHSTSPHFPNYIGICTLFTREFPVTGCNGQIDADGLFDWRNLARLTAIEDAPTPAPLVYDAFFKLL
jgi:hypothetical protein